MSIMSISCSIGFSYDTSPAEERVAQSATERSADPVQDTYMEQVWEILVMWFVLRVYMYFVFSLVYRLVGKVKEVKDNAVGADNTYYTSLLLSKADV